VTFVVFLALVLATYRLARLVCIDDITAPVRAWTYRFHAGSQARWSRWMVALLQCPHCIGVWISFAVTAVWLWASQGWNVGTVEYLILAVAVAGGQSVVSTWAMGTNRPVE
jgi:hypothetical protein